MQIVLEKSKNPNLSAVYHWWSFPKGAPAYQNLRTPIVASIASLRAVSDVECSDQFREIYRELHGNKRWWR